MVLLKRPSKFMMQTDVLKKKEGWPCQALEPRILGCHKRPPFHPDRQAGSRH